MRLDSAAIASVAAAAAAVTAGYVAGRFVELSAWDPAFSGLLTALSLMAGAVLVRLARNAPITSPSTFDEKDLVRFFDSIENLSRRLFWIFVQSIIAIFIVISAIVINHLTSKSPVFTNYVNPGLSGTLAALLIWLVWRLALMARGDIGFLRLQRQIIYNSLRREQASDADKLAKQPVTLKSVGEYGRQI